MDDKALKTVAELLEVLRRNGYNADTSYAFENFLLDHGKAEVMYEILCGDGKEMDFDDYSQIPLEERLAKFHKLPKE
tara:strand:- start:356 stop:586 length:231 start_codon:yes stop_codon:yes gene_type:complete